MTDSEKIDVNKFKSYIKKKEGGTKEGEDMRGNTRENVESDKEPEMATTSVSTNVSATDSASKVYKFKSDWLTLFPWLLFENDRMFCKYCKGQTQAGNSPFKKRLPHKTRQVQPAHCLQRQFYDETKQIRFDCDRSPE